jgi:hypothetical protein
VILGWLRRRRRQRLLATPFPEAWRALLDPLRFYRRLDDVERERLHDILRVIVVEKSWEGIGIEITDEIRVTIAALAALLVLGIEHDHFERVTSILVYPTTFENVWHGDGLIAPADPSLLGEAWYRGPVRLAWDSVREGALNPEDGRNVVLHEFAHRLDMLDGYVDGTPPLSGAGAYANWTRVMTEEFVRLSRHARRGRRTVLDPYGTTDEGEFFAVATEAFFEKSAHMERKHPELYALLKGYYRQDPAARMHRTGEAGSA